MPSKSTRKVNIYKWHRMKKKLISSVISVLCCLVVMMVGVYASTTDSFQVSIANDIDVKVVAVDGTLYARRRGGVWANPEGSESAYGNAVTEASDFTGEYYENLQKIYDIQNNLDTMEVERLCQKIDINVYHNEIEYVFKYVIDRGNIDSNYKGDGRVFKTTTKISIVNGVDGNIKPNQSNRYECSYKFYFGNNEPNWDNITGTLNVDGANTILAGDEDGKRVVYIRAYLKYNTDDYGRELSENQAEANKGLGFKGTWQFSLVLEELEGTTADNKDSSVATPGTNDANAGDRDDPNNNQGNNPGNTPGNTPDDDGDEDEFVYEISADGKYVYMGEYPQTIKANNVSIVSTTPDSDGYYLGSDGERYYKYTVNIDFDAIGWDEEEWKGYKFNKLSNGYEYSNGDTLYFKVEKIKWRILSTTDGNYLLMCDSILKGMVYQTYYGYDNESSEYCVTDADGNWVYESDGVTKIYANNYKHSELRNFLTSEFYSQSFSSTQKSMIQLSTVDNSSETTNWVYYGEGDSNQYACENTYDYVFALSYADMKNPEYGFSENAYDQAPSRNALTTDFAKVTGTITITAEFVGIGYDEYYGTGAYWLRSPGCDFGHYACDVSYGYSNDIGIVFSPGDGVLPAMQVRLP